MARVKRTCLHCKQQVQVYKGGKYDRASIFVCKSCVQALTEGFRQRVMQ